jgi:hypothetical protein
LVILPLPHCQFFFRRRKDRSLWGDPAATYIIFALGQQLQQTKGPARAFVALRVLKHASWFAILGDNNGALGPIDLGEQLRRPTLQMSYRPDIFLQAHRNSSAKPNKVPYLVLPDKDPRRRPAIQTLASTAGSQRN